MLKSQDLIDDKTEINYFLGPQDLIAIEPKSPYQDHMWIIEKWIGDDRWGSTALQDDLGFNLSLLNSYLGENSRSHNE